MQNEHIKMKKVKRSLNGRNAGNIMSSCKTKEFAIVIILVNGQKTDHRPRKSE